MVSTQPATGLTYEDYLKTSDDERWELLDGELVMAPSPSMPHQIVATDLVTLLNSFVRERGLGHVITAPADVVLSDTNVVQPDLFFVSTEREQIITRPNIQGAPDLAVEIRSPSTDLAVEIGSPSTDERDRTVKRKLYRRARQDGEAQAVRRARRQGVLARRPRRHDCNGSAAQRARLEEAGVYCKGETLTSPILQGFSVDIDDIFRP
jgi:Uma2 family endonuclease